MSELIKLLEKLDIRTINALRLDFTDNHGNFKNNYNRLSLRNNI